MSFDHAGLRRALDAGGPVVRVVVTKIAGSVPREAGASMLVMTDGIRGTIGGGALEHEVIGLARSMEGDRRVMTRALGPDLGQCCGGAVTLLMERYHDVPDPGPVARPLRDGDAAMPLSVVRLLRAWRNGADARATQVDGWFVEPEARARHALWLHGAGHVGRAIADVVAPHPDWEITWVDTAPDRFPAAIPEGVTMLPAADPARAIRHAPTDAHHLILTYSHDLDLALCDAVLRRGFASAGLIGSATKWARFRKRLRQLGHGDAQIARIACPIGDPSMGKHPQAIAIGVAGRLLIGQTPANAAGGEGDDDAAHG